MGKKRNQRPPLTDPQSSSRPPLTASTVTLSSDAIANTTATAAHSCGTDATPVTKSETRASAVPPPVPLRSDRRRTGSGSELRARWETQHQQQAKEKNSDSLPAPRHVTVVILTPTNTSALLSPEVTGGSVNVSMSGAAPSFPCSGSIDGSRGSGPGGEEHRNTAAVGVQEGEEDDQSNDKDERGQTAVRFSGCAAASAGSQQRLPSVASSSTQDLVTWFTRKLSFFASSSSSSSSAHAACVLSDPLFTLSDDLCLHCIATE